MPDARAKSGGQRFVAVVVLLDVPGYSFIISRGSPATVVIVDPKSAVGGVTRGEDGGFGVGGDGIDLAASAGDNLQFVADRGGQQVAGGIIVAGEVAEIVGVVKLGDLLGHLEAVGLEAGDAVNRWIGAGEEGGESGGLVEVGKAEADIMADGPLSQQALEAALAKGVLEIFDVIAPQLIDRDEDDQLGRALLLRLNLRDGQ